MCIDNQNPLNVSSIPSSWRGVGDKPMSCKPGVAGSIPSFSQSVS